jgi:hypothetical protein
MNEHPILFSTPMVKAILEGRKTQTRRVMLPQPKIIHEVFQYQGHVYAQTERLERDKNVLNGCVKFRYGQPDHILWVRETWYSTPDKREILGYVADGDFPHNCTYRVRPSIFLPRKFSRITLEITDIRVQRIQDISGDDAFAEGCGDIGIVPINTAMLLTNTNTIEDCHKALAVNQFHTLWDSINAKRGYSWQVNPWVWAITFKRR